MREGRRSMRHTRLTAALMILAPPSPSLLPATGASADPGAQSRKPGFARRSARPPAWAPPQAPQAPGSSRARRDATKQKGYKDGPRMRAASHPVMAAASPRPRS